MTLKRLFAPRTIVVVGGGAWCESIVSAAKAIGFSGQIIPIHPTKRTVADLEALESLSDVSNPIDAAFIGVNRVATIDIVDQLRRLDAGGAICFASGFSEAANEDATASDLQARLVAAAGDMPILGPNCYGYLNALEGTAIWPDQHGLRQVERGVAILTQSSNIAINLTMQNRALPIAMVIACGNQAQTSQAEIARDLLADDRITALGLHIEGFGDLRSWEALAAEAQRFGKPLIAIKSGASEQARAATVSHTASLAGSDAGADALLKRLGIARVAGLPAFLEALKMAHLFGRLPGNRLGSISCSGGEAALVADMATHHDVSFPPLSQNQFGALAHALGPKVALANPLDYHTYIWRDGDAMAQAWAAMADEALDLIMVVLDYPRDDMCDPSDWAIATQAVIAAHQKTGARYAVVATLPELLPETTAQHLMDHGVLPIMGIDEALAAVAALSEPTPNAQPPLALPSAQIEVSQTLTEDQAKAELEATGLRIPRARRCETRQEAVDFAKALGKPIALKVLGLAHKTGARGLALNLSGEDDILTADLAEGPLLAEEMVVDPIAELLVGVVRDPAHGFVLTLGAGGVLTEILRDTAQLLLPTTDDDIQAALRSLKIAPILDGYRGAPPVDKAALVRAIRAIEAYVLANLDSLEEVEVNPLLALADDAIAVDALIRKASPND